MIAVTNRSVMPNGLMGGKRPGKLYPNENPWKKKKILIRLQKLIRLCASCLLKQVKITTSIIEMIKETISLIHRKVVLSAHLAATRMF
jgi:hypothetical protein